MRMWWNFFDTIKTETVNTICGKNKQKLTEITENKQAYSFDLNLTEYFSHNA